MPGVLGTGGARIAGLAAGLALVAVVALSQWSVAPSRAALGLDLELSAVTHGELEVGPSGPVVRARGLRPGNEAVGAVRLRNQTAARLAVRPELREGPASVDGALRFSLTVAPGGRRIFDGTAAQLRAGAAPIVLTSGERATIAVRAYVAEGAQRATRGRAGEWRLGFETEIVR